MNDKINEQDAEELKAYSLKVHNLANDITGIIMNEKADCQISALSTVLGKVLLTLPDEIQDKVMLKALTTIAKGVKMAEIEQDDISGFVIAFRIIDNTIH